MYSLASAVELSQARTDSSASAGERACVSMSFAASGVENACASISSSAALVGDACVSMISSALAVESWTTRGAASDSATARVCCAMTCAASAGERTRAGRTELRATQSGVDAFVETSAAAAGTSGASEERSGLVDAEAGAAAGASAKRWSTMPLRSERRDCCKGVGAGSESEPTWGAPVPTGEADARGDRSPVPTGCVPVLGNEAEPATDFAAVVPAGGTTTADGPPTPTDTGLAAGRWSRR